MKQRLSILLGLIIMVFTSQTEAGLFNPKAFTLKNGLEVVVVARISMEKKP